MNTALNEEINSYISYGEDNNSDDESNLPERCDISGETVLNVAFNAVAARIDSTDTDSESATVPSEDKFWQCQENSGISDSKDNYVGNHDGQFAIDNRIQRPPLEKSLSEESSLIDGLLCEIYDRWHGGSFRADSFDSDTFTECSSTSEALHIPGYTGRGFPSDAPWQKVRSRQVHREFLRSKGIPQLKSMLADLRQSNAQMSIRIIRQLKRRDRRLAKLQKNYDIVTAILQASSLKRLKKDQSNCSLRAMTLEKIDRRPACTLQQPEDIFMEGSAEDTQPPSPTEASHGFLLFGGYANNMSSMVDGYSAVGSRVPGSKELVKLSKSIVLEPAVRASCIS